MTARTDPLGGRLPLLDPDELSGAQRKVYDRIVATMVPWADASGFRSRTEDGRLIGPFNPVLLSPGVTSGFLDLQEADILEISRAIARLGRVEVGLTRIESGIAVREGLA